MKNPNVGPLVGQNTNEMLRILVRGDKENNYASLTLYSDIDCKDKILQRTIPLSESYDYSNVFLIKDLDSGRKYYYKVGIHKDDKAVINFNELTEVHSIKILENDKDTETKFLIGSCRYIMETAGLWMFGHQSDKTFRTALHECGVLSGDIDFMMHLGDQIYADDLNVLSADEHLEQFYRKYRYAFTTPYFKSMASSIGNYMILDDHEIEDNWPDQRTHNDKKKYFNAMHSYQIYQASHSPVVPTEYEGATPTKLKQNPTRWYYEYQSGCADFFVLDVRTERVVNGDTKIISDLQMRNLKSWLLDNKDRVKCITTSVPFLMNTPDGCHDKWGDERFMHQRNEILEFIYDNSVEKVIFLSGDIHASYVASASKDQRLISTKPIKIYQVVSSPLYYPYHFLENDPSGYQEGVMRGTDDWILKNETRIITDSGIAKVSIKPDSFSFKFFERKGDLIKSCTFDLKGRTYQDILDNDEIKKNVLKSIPWYKRILNVIKGLFNFRRHKKLLS